MVEMGVRGVGMRGVGGRGLVFMNINTFDLLIPFAERSDFNNGNKIF